MKNVNINEINYEIIENYKDGFDLAETKEKLTEYFEEYDYIFGDWAYGKLRLKGFCDSTNSKFNGMNNYKNVDKYLKEFCAYECRYFLLKKIK